MFLKVFTIDRRGDFDGRVTWTVRIFLQPMEAPYEI